jgi:hypothetical protein
VGEKHQWTRRAGTPSIVILYFARTFMAGSGRFVVVVVLEKRKRKDRRYVATESWARAEQPAAAALVSPRMENLARRAAAMATT